MSPYSQDRDFVASKYQAIWGAIYDFVEAKAKLPNTDLPTLLRQAWQYSLRLTESISQKDGKFFIDGSPTSLSPLQREFVARDLVAAVLIEALHRSTDTIVELGSGWSANLFNLWLRGGPRRARYFGCEYSLAGRNTSILLAEKAEGMSFDGCAFDWYEPNFDFLPKDGKHVMIFSCHSIEQIPDLPMVVFERILESTKNAQTVTGVHFEPVGWQYPERFSDSSRLLLSRRYAEEKNYNKNLRDVLEYFVERKHIRMDSLEVDRFGSEMNPASLIIWRRE